MEYLLSGGGDGGHSASVKGVLQGDNLGAAVTVFVVRIFAGGLDGAFICLGARIGVENALHTGGFAQQLGQLAAGHGVIKVGGVLQFAQLFGNSLLPVGVAEPQAVYADAAGKIDLFSPVEIGKRCALSPFESDLKAGVRRSDIFVVLIFYRLKVHFSMQIPYIFSLKIRKRD